MTRSVIDVPQHRGQFFEILQETARCQTAVMTVAPGQDGGPEETHAGDQVVYVIEGEGILTIGGAEHRVRPGVCALIPAGTLHHVKNAGAEPLFFLSVYAPPAY
jgi:mannose-6-phosphate isomerase-like protein (cupin superfamily)